MQYRRLGTSGLKVSEICLGTMTFGHTTDEAEARRIVDLAFDAGVNFFDTANTYGGSRAEVLLGSALQGRRGRVVVATKFFNPTGPGPNDSGASRGHIMDALAASLRRLQTDYVDLCYIHHVDEQTPLEETLRALDDLVRQGKVRYIACSNHPAWRLCDGLWISDAKGLARFAAYQGQYSLVVRDLEQEVLPLCQHKGVGFVAWGPMAGGFLTGKYQPGQRELAGTRSAEKWVWQVDAFAPNADAILAALLDVSGQVGRPAAQVALRWVLAQPGVSAVIAGARTAAQLRDSLGASAWALPDELCQRLDAASRQPDRFPQSMERTMRQRRDNAVRPPSPPSTAAEDDRPGRSRGESRAESGGGPGQPPKRHAGP